jgi:hypothetical protein
MHIWPFCFSRCFTLATAGLRDETNLAGEASNAGFQICLTFETSLGQSASECQHYFAQKKKNLKPPMAPDSIIDAKICAKDAIRMTLAKATIQK